MSNHKIFVKDTYGGVKRVGASAAYSYNPKRRTLTISWDYGSSIKLNNVDEGDPIWIGYDSGTPEVRRIKLPRKKADCLAWLLNFPKGVRTHTEEDYKNLLERQRKTYGRKNYEEYACGEDHRWGLTLCNRPDCKGVQPIACFISDEVADDKTLVKSVLKAWGSIKWMHYPKTFVKNTLKKRFGFSDTDLEEVDSYLKG